MNNNKEKHNEANRKYRRTHKDKIKEYEKNNKERIRKIKKKWSDKNKEYYKNYRENNKNKAKEYSKKYRNDNQDRLNKLKKEYRNNNKDKIKEYYKDNRIKLAELKKEYRNNNKDKIRIYEKKHYKEHPELARKRDRKRRAIKEKIIETFSDKEWLQKLKNTFGVCPRCNKYVGMAYLTLDHIYPVSLAYKDYLKTGIKEIYTIDDVQPLCRSCNSKKYNTIEGTHVSPKNLKDKFGEIW